MKKIDLDNIVHKRRIVIGFQLLVLVLILGTIFIGLLTNPPAEKEKIADLENISNSKLSDENQLNKPSLLAEAAFVYDVKKQEVIYSQNSETPLPIASITKLMTALIAYELTTEAETASISKRSVLQDGSSGLTVGEQLTLESLYQLSLISSSNDAAFALADNVGELLGSEDGAAQFVAAMNIRAEELGLESLEFLNPTGLDVSPHQAGAVGSAHDISLLLSYMINNYPSLLETTTQYQARVYSEEGVFHDVENTNDVLLAIPNLMASKTGYTDLAGGNLTVAYDAGFNRPIVVTVLGSTYNGRFNDVLKLIEFTNSNFE